MGRTRKQKIVIDTRIELENEGNEKPLQVLKWYYCLGV
jgi:hypothetical protein